MMILACYKYGGGDPGPNIEADSVHSVNEITPKTVEVLREHLKKMMEDTMRSKGLFPRPEYGVVFLSITRLDD